MADWDVVSNSPQADPWAVVSHEPHAKDGDPVPASGVPQGFYAVTGDDGKKTLRHEWGVDDVIKALSDIPGVGAAERMGQGAVRLGGKAASGIAGLFGADPRAIQQQVNAATELPPSNDPLVQGTKLLERGASAVAAPVDRAIGNLPPGPRTAIEGVEEAAPDVLSLVGGLGGELAGRAGESTLNIARTPEEVASAAGYTGLRTRGDLIAPGNQAITDTLISRDAGMVPGQAPSVTALQNGIRVGPAKVYAQAEASLPARLTQDPELREGLSNLPQQVSQLPRSPDVEALQETMLAQPEFTRDELFANIREARERAKAHWKSDDPDKAALGDAYHSLAGAYEDFAGRQLEAAQAPVSLADWQAARTQMAKNYQAQGALRGDHFDARVYGQLAERNPGLLTGNAAIVGNVANRLPPASTAGVGLGDIAPTALGVGAGELAGHTAGVPVVGGVMGALAGPMIRAKLRDLLTRGNPEAAAKTATNPELSYFFDQGRMPPGWNRAPSSPLPSPFGGYLPSPDMINAGGGATTANVLRNLGLTPDVQAAGAAHPAAARLTALREQLSRPPMEEVPFQGPQKWGDFSIAPQNAPTRMTGQEGIPFENVLEQGGTDKPPVGAVSQAAPRRVLTAPKQPNVRTPPGEPTIAAGPPPGPSPAQIAFRNKLAADRLRKVAGDLSVEGPGAATGSPADRLLDALKRRERGYAEGGQVLDFAKKGAQTLLERIQNAFHNPYTADINQLRQDVAKYWTTTTPPPMLALPAPQEPSLEDITRSLHELVTPGAPEEYAEGGGVMQKLSQFLDRIASERAAQDAELAARYPNRPRPPLVQAPPEGATTVPASPLQPPAAPDNPLQPGFLGRPQAKADGGSVDTPSSVRKLADAARALNPDTLPQATEDRARIATNLASLAYGLDAQGRPALGGRAWTSTQGGTPIGVLDAITAVPHNLVQLGALADKYLPGKSNPQFWSSIDPSWSQQASQRLSQLRQRMQQAAGVAPAANLEDTAIDTVTDPAMLAPLGAAKVASKASALRSLLNWGAGGTEDAPTAQGSH